MNRGVKAGIAAVVATLGTALCLPARSTPPTQPAWRPARPVVGGVFHVHTDRSDGAGSVDTVALAASRSGLQFVVLTDHGDGMRPPLASAYRSGVLVIDGVEISTTDGHYAAAGLAPSPYPLAGEGRDVAEDVRRLGGFGVVAHGESSRVGAQWHDWDAPVDGLEWLNLDAAWREAAPLALARGLLTYWFRAPETLATFLLPAIATLERFDRLARGRHAIAIASPDAHGHALASYEACFRTTSTRVELDQPLKGDAAVDAAAVVRALALGHHHTVIDAFAAAPAFEFTGSQLGRSVIEGDVLMPGAPVTFASRVNGPPGSRSSLLRDGVRVHSTSSPSWQYRTDGRAGTYRVEVWLDAADRGRARVPWIVSNPIHVLAEDESPDRRSAGPPRDRAGRPVAWQAEADRTSLVTVERIDASGVRLRYTLGPGAPTNQYAAAAAPVPPDIAHLRGVTMTARADRPVRVSLQLRAKRELGAPSWQRSVYVDSDARTWSIAFDDMRPVRPADPSRVPLSSIDSILILVGLTNGRPATSAEVTVSDFGFER